MWDHLNEEKVESHELKREVRVLTVTNNEDPT